MATNLYFAQGTRSEQVLYEDLIIESLKMYGQDIYYIPREIVKRDRIFEDDAVSRFDNAYRIETYIENTEGFDGEGDLFTKFGVEIRDAATFIMARRRWESQVASLENTASNPFYRPREGDLLYLVLSGSIFEITKVEDEAPFYQLKDLPVFKMRAELFEYNDEDFDTGIPGIDLVETAHAYQTKLFITTSEAERATATATLTGDGVTSIAVADGGGYYTDAPNITIYDSSQDSAATATATVVGGVITAITVDSAGSGYTTTPIVTIAKPPITFDMNEAVLQNNGTFTMSGEVVEHNDSDGILMISHGGATDGEFHNWTTTNPVVGQDNNVSVTPTSIGEDLQDGAQNEFFDAEASSFIDFTETNPFGEP